jgi:hypothetical protein
VIGLEIEVGSVARSIGEQHGVEVFACEMRSAQRREQLATPREFPPEANFGFGLVGLLQIAAGVRGRRDPLGLRREGVG